MTDLIEALILVAVAIAVIIWRTVKIVGWKKRARVLFSRNYEYAKFVNSGKFKFYKYMFHDWHDYQNRKRAGMITTVFMNLAFFIGIIFLSVILAKDCFLALNTFPGADPLIVYLVMIFVGHVVAYAVAWRGMVCTYYTLVFPILVFFIDKNKEAYRR